MDLAQIVVRAKDETAAGIKGAVSNLQELHNEADSFNSTMKTMAGLLGLGLFSAFIVDTVAGIAELKRMQEQTGATADEVQLLRKAAKLAGEDFGTVPGALNKLSKSLVDAHDPTSKQAQLLKQLGISAVDAEGNLRKPAEVYVELAGKLAEFEDGAGKAAVAQRLLGKSGADQLPILKQLAEMQEFRARLTQQDIDGAKLLEQNLTKLGDATTALKTTIATGVVPVLNDFIAVLLKGQKESSGLRDELDQMKKAGELTAMFRAIAMVVAFVVDIFIGFARAVEILGKTIGSTSAALDQFSIIAAGVALILNGQWKLGAEVVKRGWEGMKAGVEAYKADLDEVANRRWFSDKLKAQFDASDEAMLNSAGIIKKKQLNVEDATEADKKMEAAYQKLFESLGTDIAKLGFEIDYFEKYGKAAAGAAQAAVLFELSQGKLAKLDPKRASQLLDMAVMKDTMAEGERAVKAFWAKVKADNKQGADDWEKLQEDIANATIELRDQTKSIYADMISDDRARTAAQLAIESRKWKEIISYAEEGTEERKQLEQAFLDWLAAKQIKAELAEFQKLYGGVDKAAHDFFVDILSGNRDAWTNLKETAKREFFDWLYVQLAKPYVLRLAAQVFGLSPAAQAAMGATTSAGSSTVAGAVGSYVGNSIGGMSVGGTAIGGTADFMAGWQGVSSLGMTGAEVAAGEGATWMSTAGATLAEIPVYGWIAAAVLAIGAYLAGRHRGGPKTGGSYMGGYGPAGDFISVLQTPGTDNGRFFTPNQGDSFAQGLVTATSQGIFAALKRFGASTTGFGIGLGFDNDPNGTSPSRVSAMLTGSNGQVLYSARDVEVDDKEVPTELKLQASRMLLAALKASDLPKAVAGFLSTIQEATATQEEIDSAIQGAMAIRQIMEIVAKDPLQDLAQQALDAEDALGTALKNNASALNDAMDAFDGTATSVESLAGVTAQYYTANLQLMAQLRQMKQTIDDMFESTARGIQLAGLDNQGKYNFYQNEADSLLNQLMGSNDPAEVQRLAQRINDDINAAFGLLSPDEQRAMGPEFLARITRVEEAAGHHVDELEQRVEESTQTMLTRVGDLMEGYFARGDHTADRIQDAAGTLDDAAHRISQAFHDGIEVRVPAVVVTAGGGT